MMTRPAAEAVQPDFYTLLPLPQMEQTNPPGQAPAERAVKANGAAGMALGAVGVATHPKKQRETLG
jgi:hypothetical protein